jgi:hypothetical protein
MKAKLVMRRAEQCESWSVEQLQCFCRPCAFGAAIATTGEVHSLVARTGNYRNMGITGVGRVDYQAV